MLLVVLDRKELTLGTVCGVFAFGRVQTKSKTLSVEIVRGERLSRRVLTCIEGLGGDRARWRRP